MSFKITRRDDGRVVAVCEGCGATSGTPQPEGYRVTAWQRAHVCQPKGGRA